VNGRLPWLVRAEFFLGSFGIVLTFVSKRYISISYETGRRGYAERFAGVVEFGPNVRL
jgi:hypothetical protein